MSVLWHPLAHTTLPDRSGPRCCQSRVRSPPLREEQTMPRIAHLLLLASAVAVPACSDDSPTEPAALADSALELAQGAPTSRPAGGQCRTQFEFQSSDVILIQLDCNLLHLGLTTGTSTQTITVTGQTPTGQLSAV